MDSDDVTSSSSDDETNLAPRESKGGHRADSPYTGGSGLHGHAGGIHGDVSLGVPYRITREAHPNYVQIVDSQQALPPFGVDQLRQLQTELGTIATGLQQTYNQLEKERNTLEGVIRQRSYSSYGSEFVDPDDALDQGSASPSKGDDRGTRIRTTTPYGSLVRSLNAAPAVVLDLLTNLFFFIFIFIFFFFSSFTFFFRIPPLLIRIVLCAST